MKTGIKYLVLVIFLFVGLIYLISQKGLSTLQVLFWDVKKDRIEYVFDTLKCRVQPASCVFDKNLSSINFGVYDFNKTYKENKNLAFDHYFFNWSDSQFVEDLPQLFTSSTQNGRWVLLTVEPFARSEDSDVLKSVVDSKYDADIDKICKTINSSKNPVFIRWGHEMERVTGRYPWAVDDSSKYIDAYNYFVNRCKSDTSNGIYVWSPAGESNLDKYWPGSENVDYVGISLYIYRQFEQDNYRHIRTFKEAYEEKENRVSKFGKPIIIAEFGINNDKDFQKIWWYNAARYINNYPKLKTIVYFNAIDSAGVWGNYSTPDWSIINNIFPGGN